ncbi:MAG TPA: hypothetical protein VL966_06980 [Alphaproteobacteria bacterium]|jgi:hypothetical protein|nr:hypothetical protein [Alphaproteobacteria bacterium]
MRSPYRSPLGRLAVSAMNEEDLVALRRRVWRETGVAVIKPDDLTDDTARAAITKTATELFGPRLIRATKEDL